MGRQPLQPGEHTIMQVKATNFRKGKAIRWSGKDWAGHPHKKRTQGKDVGECRARALRTWEKILAESAGVVTDSSWTLDDSITQFIDEVVIPAVEGADTKPRTQARYLEVLQLFRTDTEGRSIRSLKTAAAIKAVVKTIADKHGPESARQARSVVSAYVIQQQIEYGLLDRNPIHGVSMPFTRTKKEHTPIPTVEEWKTLLRFILHEEDANAPMPGQDSPQAKKLSARARHARVMELTVLQMATGLRISEALTLTWENVEIDNEGTAWVTVTAELAKTGKARKVPVLVPEVSAALAKAHAGTGLVIPAPTDASKAWERGGATKAVRHYYTGLAGTQGFEFLRENRSHVWRKVLTTAMAGILPPHLISAYFGHTPEVSGASYTDSVSVKPVIETSKLILLENNDTY